MARWKLRTPHYLNCIDPYTGGEVQWEHKETDRTTGRTNRKLYTVPLLLDNRDQADWNYKDQEAIIVTNAENLAFPKDIVFRGDPTPDMEPLDKEAEEISASFAERWATPYDTFQTSEAQLSPETLKMMAEFAKMIGAKVTQPNASVPEVSLEDFAKLKAELAEMKAALAATPARRA